MKKELTPEQTAVKKAIKSARKMAAMSQGDLASMVGVTQQAVSGWEQTGEIDKSHWDAIRSAIGVDVGAVAAKEYLVVGSINDGGAAIVKQRQHHGHQVGSGRMEVTNNYGVKGQCLALSMKEANLIDELRKKDKAGHYLDKFLAEILLVKMDEE